MEFKKYSSIENSSRTKEIDYIVEQGKSGGQWVCVEKVHGSNLSFWYDGKEIKTAKRTAFLGEHTSFFNYQYVRDEHVVKIKKLWDEIKSNVKKDVEYIVIYGELFGGNYLHDDVEREYNAMVVQKGVYYSPGNNFYAFDIKIDGAFVDVWMFDVLCEEAGFFAAVSLFIGTFKECLEYSNIFQTTIPKRLSLPEIKDNMCEGVVIKPVKPVFFFNGSRIILKNKNEKFAESKSVRKSRKNNQNINIFDITISDEAQKHLNIVIAMVTENRLRNVLSKIGQVTDRQFGIVVGNLNRDIMEEYLKDHKKIFRNFPKNEQKYITKKMGNESQLLIRKHFLNIIDGIF